jgi:hypothetical protein
MVAEMGACQPYDIADLAGFSGRGQPCGIAVLAAIRGCGQACGIAVLAGFRVVAFMALPFLPD